MKYLFFLAILLAAFYADASYDASYLTINGKPTIEIVINDKVCHFPVNEVKDLSKTEIKKLIDTCLRLK